MVAEFHCTIATWLGKGSPTNMKPCVDNFGYLVCLHVCGLWHKGDDGPGLCVSCKGRFKEKVERGES